MEEPRLGKTGRAAVVSDLLATLGGESLSLARAADFYLKDARQERNWLKVILIACWLPHAGVMLNTHKAARIVAICLIALSFGLNTYRLGAESIWVDEGATIAAARGPTTQIVPILIAVVDNNPPLTYLAWHYWSQVVGLSEFALRALAALAGLVSVALLYKAGAWLFGRRIGLLAAALLACSGFHIDYAQMIRSYMFLELGTLASFALFVRWLRRGGSVVLCAYTIVNVLLLYTHYYGLFVLLAQTVYVGWLRWRWGRPSLLRWLFLQALIGAAFLPWLPMLIFQSRRAVSEIAPPTLGLLVGTFLEYTWSLTAFVLAAVLLAAGAYTLVRPILAGRAAVVAVGRRGRRPGAGLALVWFSVVMGVPIVISFLVTPIFLSRYAIAALPAFYILIAWMAARVIRPPVGMTLAGLLIAGQLGGLLHLYQNVKNEQWRDAAHYLDAQARPGDLLIFYAGIGRYSFDYYSQRSDLARADLGLANGPAKVRAILADSQQAGAIWLVLTYREPDEFDPIFRQNGYHLEDEQFFFRIALRGYRKAGP